MFGLIRALWMNQCEIPVEGRSGGWQPGSCDEEEEEEGKGCTTVWESPGMEALCSRSHGERLAGARQPLSATAFKEFSVSVAAL